METQTIQMSQLISALISLAGYSGEIIRNVHASGNLNTYQKGYNDPCTFADTESQKIIQETLLKLWPSLKIIGEEDIQREQSAAIDLTQEQLNIIDKVDEKWSNINLDRITVWVDPLDGTLEFTQGDPERVTTLLGVAVEDEAIAGVINKPFNKEMLWGCRDTGVFFQAQEGGTWEKLEPKKLDKVTVAVTKQHKTERTELGQKLLNGDENIQIGGQGSKSWAVIKSEVAVLLYPSTGTKKWDTCAPEALIRALGGQLTNVYGQSYKYNKEIELLNDFGTLATLYDHQIFVERLNSLPKVVER